MKKFILLILIIFVFIITFIYFNKEEKENLESDVHIKEKILDNKLNVTYIKGNLIDESLSYGNKFEKYIKIENKNKGTISYALSLTNKEISDKDLIYNVYASHKENEFVNKPLITSNINDDYLIHSLGIKENEVIYLKVEFISKNENNKTKLKGKINIVNNLGEKGIFLKEIEKIKNEVDNIINEKNGIGQSGYYYLDVTKIDKNLKGIILIDASDIVDIKYKYYIKGNKYMVNNNLKVLDLDDNMFNDNGEVICNQNTKKQKCKDINSLEQNIYGNKKTFIINVENIIKRVKESYNNLDNNVYVVNVNNNINNDTNIYGYILIDNSHENNEYYLYLTNNMFMISGYNYTKRGDIKENSKTVRAYNITSFNLSSENEEKVCSFSGFSNCIIL